jgi:lipoprotein NlpI
MDVRFPHLLLLLCTVTLCRATPAAETPPRAPRENLADLISSSRSALARGDTDRALSLANDAVRCAPDAPLTYALRAAVHDARREFDKSLPDYDKVVSLVADNLPAHQRRGEAHFRLGRFKESVADFDKVIALDPAREPHHWQRGISLYYAGEYERGAKQFELHRTVNPDDVENAAWHYLCVARQSGVDKARQALIPIAHDPRIPMMKIHALFDGKATPDEVLKAAGAGDPPPAELKHRLMYAHLYIGLYHEAAGNAAKAAEHIKLAASNYAGTDYMSDVARAHAALMKAPATN